MTLLDRIQELAGNTVAAAIQAEFGGCTCYVPYHPRPDSHVSSLRPVLANGAPPVAVPVAVQDELLASLEARLADEMLNLVAALQKFSAGAQAVSKELPLSAQFGKNVTLFFSLSSLHLANALFQRPNLPLLADDGAEQLNNMCLSLHEFVREVDLDGRRFLAVALPNKPGNQVAQCG